MSKVYHNRTTAVTARPRSQRLREAGYYKVNSNSGSNADQTSFETGPELFEGIVDNNGDLTGAKALYDIFIKQVEADPQQGIEEQLKNATEILKHLFLVPNDGRPYIRSDIGFVSEDFVSGAGLSTTQGGGGGGGSIATLSDVSLSGLANGNILRYDASVGMWRNEALNLGTAASYNIGIVAQGDNGLVTGGAVYDAINTILSSAVKFVGITTTALTDGSTTSTVTIDGASHTAQRGDVVIYGGKEFLWTGSKWQQMGDEASWALKTITITGTGYLTGGGTLEANRTIDIAEEYKTMIQHGDTAYGWGNHATAGYVTDADISAALAGYLPLTGGTLTGPLSINSSLTVAQRVVVNGDFFVRAENFRIYVRDYVTTETPADRYILRFTNDTENNTTSLIIGDGTYGNTPTYLFGKNFRFTTYNGSTGVHAMYINSSGNVGIGVSSPSLKLDVAGDIRARNRLYIGTGGAYIEVDADGNLHTTNAFYSDSFVSGGGLSTTPGGGGGGGVDLAAMWNSLTNSVTDAYANTPIDVAHIPNITTAKISDLEGWILGKGYATSSALAGYLPLTGGTLSGNLEISKRNTALFFTEQRISSSSGEWAADCLTFRDTSETVHAAIGWYGNAMTPNWMYIGFGTYAAANNLRIYPDGVRFGSRIIWHQGNDGAGSGLDADLLDGKDGSYYATAASLDNYVSSVSISGNALRIAKGESTNDLTVPFATASRRPFEVAGTAAAGGYDLDTMLEGGGITRNYGSAAYWGHAPAGAAYGSAVQISTGRANHSLDMQLLWDIYHNNDTVATRRLWWRAASNKGWKGDWHLVYDSESLTQAVVTGLIGNTIYAPYHTDGYLPLSGGTLTGVLTVNSSLTTTGTIIAGNNIHFSKSSFNDITATASNGSFRFFTGGDTVDYAMYIDSNKNVSFAGSTLISGNIYGRRNDFRLYVRDTVSAETASDRIAIRFYNNESTGFSSFYIGSGTYVTSPTYIYGREIRFATHNGTTGATVMTITSAGNVGIGVTSTSLKLDVAGDIRARDRLYIGTGGAYIEVDSSGNLHTASGFYSDSFVSGSGLSTTQGGGSGGVDLAAMWNSLTNSVTDAYANTPIDVAHIPDITTNKISNLEDWIASKNFITAASLPLAASGTRGGVQIGYTTDATNRNYAVQLSSEQAYVNVPWIEYNFTGVSFTSGDRYTGTHDANAIMSNGVWYYQSHGPAISIGASTNDGALYSQAYSTQWVVQIAQDYRNGRLFFRARNNSAWTTWLTNIDSGNYASILDPWVEAKGYALAASIPSALPNPYVLSFGSKTYDGSAATTLTAADLGALTSINVTNYDSTLSRNASSMTLARVQGTAITVSVPNFALVSDIPIELPNPKALTFNTSQRSYDGSAAMTRTAADLGALTTVQVVNYDSTLSRNASSMTLARVHGTAITVSVPNFALVSDIPTALPNPYALSFGSKTYNGSASRTITAGDLGLGSAASNIDTLFSYFNGYGAANEAVQLTTTRTIWGQEFDGTQNVSGAISGATTGAFSSWVQASMLYLGSSGAYINYQSSMMHSSVGFYADGPLSGAGLSTTSDVRLKTDITDISFEKARSVIAELRPVTFRWRADGTLSAGFIAQEVAPFLPDAVTEVGGTLRLKYDQIFTYGMAVLSGLLGKTESIERRVHRLEGEVRSLREENNRLRARLNA